ncbi:MAG: alanine--glyoxylate aminotransferase family protein [Candidatus Sumerlaeaceae bacterium]|nr:alanine--glyoxylate aminotransferase family protein [Candidatus Sumerlaeaceae bacterium]
MLKKNYIYAPGPVTVPPQVLAATAKPVIHHRAADFDPLFRKVSEDLKVIFQTQHPVVTFASSGTGAMEAAIVSTASPGDHVISMESGKFGERWGLMAQAFGFDVDRVQFEWGTGPDPNLVADLLKKRPDTRAVYIELCETSTGTLSDVKAIAEVTRNTDTLLIVDAVSGLCADELRTDEWGVDLVGAGSQKGMMLPPGLGFVSVSPKAQEAVKKSKSAKFYFSLAKALKSLAENTTPFTPAVNLIFGLEVALDMLKAEGMENVWKRHARLAEASRRAMKAIGCTLFSQSPANTITAVNVPEGVDGSKIVKTLREMGMTIAGGQDHLKGKIFRFATLGYYNEFDVVTIVDAVEQCLAKLGHKFERGAGINAAREYFSTTAE